MSSVQMWWELPHQLCLVYRCNEDCPHQLCLRSLYDMCPLTARARRDNPATNRITTLLSTCTILTGARHTCPHNSSHRSSVGPSHDTDLTRHSYYATGLWIHNGSTWIHFSLACHYCYQTILSKVNYKFSVTFDRPIFGMWIQLFYHELRLRKCLCAMSLFDVVLTAGPYRCLPNVRVSRLHDILS